MDKHTPTPWSVSPQIGENILPGYVCGPVPHGPIALRFPWKEDAFNDPKSEDYSLAQANAAYIVLCVNSWDDPVALRARLAELESSK